jgi:hypothetical protein
MWNIIVWNYLILIWKNGAFLQIYFGSEMFISLPDWIRILPKVSDPAGSGSATLPRTYFFLWACSVLPLLRTWLVEGVSEYVQGSLAQNETSTAPYYLKRKLLMLHDLQKFNQKYRVRYPMAYTVARQSWTYPWPAVPDCPWCRNADVELTQLTNGLTFFHSFRCLAKEKEVFCFFAFCPLIKKTLNGMLSQE